MLKFLYVRFLLWALGPVLNEIRDRQSAVDVNIACAQAQLDCAGDGSHQFENFRSRERAVSLFMWDF